MCVWETGERQNMGHTLCALCVLGSTLLCSVVGTHKCVTVFGPRDWLCVRALMCATTLSTHRFWRNDRTRKIKATTRKKNSVPATYLCNSRICVTSFNKCVKYHFTDVQCLIWMRREKEKKIKSFRSWATQIWLAIYNGINVRRKCSQRTN